MSYSERYTRNMSQRRSLLIKLKPRLLREIWKLSLNKIMKKLKISLRMLTLTITFPITSLLKTSAKPTRKWSLLMEMTANDL